MANTRIPLTNARSGHNVITQVVSSSTVQSTTDQNSSQTQRPLQKFLKGKPKVLGAVQIMIGLLTILLGIMMLFSVQSISVFSGVVFWGSLFHIIAGSLTVSASNNLNVCVVKATLVLNIFSTIAAGIAIIMLSLDLVIPHTCYYVWFIFGCISKNLESHIKAIIGALLALSLLQFVISITVSAFACKATCTDQTTLTIINVVPNTAGGAPVANSIPDYQAQPGVSTMGPGRRPPKNPPPYYKKGNGYN